MNNTITEKMSIYEFGKQLLDLNDLDPLYIAIHEAQLEPETLHRFLLAFWCFYNAGTASWITGLPSKYEDAYWTRMETAAGSKLYPRCHERRHFRGENARKSVAFLKEKGIKELFYPLVNREEKKLSTDVADVMQYVKTWYGFGPWIAFKVADMVERLGLSKVEFDKGSMFLFDSPQEGAELLWSIEHPGEEETKGIGTWAVNRILEELGDYDAPPRYERKINAQECETVLCKWKSSMGGHYELGEDVVGLREGLLKFSKTNLSQELLKGGRKGGLWKS